MNLRRPGEGPYARVERECRWTVARLPTDARRTAEILDRYIAGTRLRLRPLLAEVELDPDDVRGPAPSFAVRDVTNNDRFSGGALAFASEDALKSLLQEAGVGGRD